jgi:hypothetical protein
MAAKTVVFRSPLLTLHPHPAVLATWVEHHANPDSVPGRDFMALNKRATISKMVSAKDVTAFRKVSPRCI